MSPILTLVLLAAALGLFGRALFLRLAPASAAGRPYLFLKDVKELDGALKHHLADGAPGLRGLARPQGHGADASSATPPLVGEVISPDTVRACTTCGWCETACPVFVENIPRFVDLRRHQVLVEAAAAADASVGHIATG